jgi:hypothetical protein
MNSVRLSIGVISYDASAELRETLLSLGHIPDSCELILQLSTAEPEAMKTLCDEFVAIKALSPGDSGIYDAMNKIRLAATGEFLWFLNAGDQMHPDRGLNEIADQLTYPSCYGFQSEQVFAGDTYLRPAARESNPPYYRIGHQSAIYHRSAYQQIAFDERIPVSADVTFNQNCFALTGMRYVPIRISRFHLGGLSNRYLLSDFSKYAGESISLRAKFLLKAALRLLVGQRKMYRLLALGKYDYLRKTDR